MSNQYIFSICFDKYIYIYIYKYIYKQFITNMLLTSSTAFQKANRIRNQIYLPTVTAMVLFSKGSATIGVINFF